MGGDGDGVCDVEGDQGICILKSLLWRNKFGIYQVVMEVFFMCCRKGGEGEEKEDSLKLLFFNQIVFVKFLYFDKELKI